RARAAGDEEQAALLVDPQPVGTLLAAFGVPGRHGLMRLEVDRQRAVLVLQVGVEAAPGGVDREAFRLAVEAELRLLAEGGTVEDADRFVARRGHPQLPGR